MEEMSLFPKPVLIQMEQINHMKKSYQNQQGMLFKILTKDMTFIQALEQNKNSK